jgi:hypothetical protein
MSHADVCSSWELTMALGLACAFLDAGLTAEYAYLSTFFHVSQGELNSDYLEGSCVC